MSSPTRRSAMQQALRARDAGLRRVSLATRVLVAGAVASTGLFTTLAAWAQPGRPSVNGSARPGQIASSTPANVGGVGSGGGDDNLSPPAAVPDPGGYPYSAPVVVSGAS